MSVLQHGGVDPRLLFFLFAGRIETGQTRGVQTDEGEDNRGLLVSLEGLGRD